SIRLRYVQASHAGPRHARFSRAGVEITRSWRRRILLRSAGIRSRNCLALETAGSPDVLVKVFEILPHGDHELIGVSAVDRAVVVTENQPDDVADGDGVVPIVICDDNRFFEDAAHAQDRQLRLHDDRRTELWTEDTGIGNGYGAALHFVGDKFFGAGALAEI